MIFNNKNLLKNFYSSIRYMELKNYSDKYVYLLIKKSIRDLNQTIGITNLNSSSLNILNENDDVRASVTNFESQWFFIIFITIFNIILSFFCISNNSLILWIVHKSQRLRNITNYFICNLACADILIGIFVAPFQVLKKKKLT